MEVQNVDMISGSTRLPNAKWSLNCYQMQHENYQLKLLNGYRQSTSESCLVCDYVRGPFLAKTKLFKELKFHAKIPNQDALILDLFWRFKYKYSYHLLTCPDIMSNIHSEDPEKLSKNDFKEVAENYHIYDLQLWNDVNFKYSSQDLEKIECQKSSGIALSPACTEV